MGGGIGYYVFTAADTGYEIARSLRFNSADSAYLNRTPSTAGNRKTWTWAGWVMKVDVSGFDPIFSAGVNPWTDIGFNSDKLRCVLNAGSGEIGAISNSVFRDPSAWYHIVFAVDTTQAVAADRIKFYVNGISVSHVAGASGYPTQNYDTYVNSTTTHRINADGQVSGGGIRFADCYLADVHFIDGQALDPTSFGVFDANGVWQPIEYTGTYGTNGFHLPFSDNSTTAALGTDTSGNDNDWTVNNIFTSTIAISGAELSTNNTGGNTITSPNSAFDGITSTYARVSLPTGGSRGLVWTPTSPYTVSSSLRVYWSSWTSTTYNLGYVYVNDINQGQVPSNLNGWYDVGFIGTLNKLELRSVYVSGGGHHISLAAIEIDGAIISASEIDSLFDSPTNGTQEDTGAGGEVVGNYCTWNPLDFQGITLSNGNLDTYHSTSTWLTGRSSFGMSSGKWYWETTAGTGISTTTTYDVAQVGISKSGVTGELLLSPTGWSYYSLNGHKGNSGGVSYGATWEAGDVIGIAFDADNGTLTFYKNNTSQGVAFTGLTSGPYFPAISQYSTSGSSCVTNFGQRAFAYSAPSGFKALCTSNLPTPTIADGSDYMDVVTYTGNGSTQTISGLDFSPDFVWIKGRSNARNNNLYDTVRGATNYLTSDTTNAENTSSDLLTTFNSDGFSLGNNVTANGSSEAYVSWTWDAGSSTVTNNEGSITSQVRANPSAGFSVVTYTGTGSSATIGHGLNAVPYLIITKRRSDTSSWGVQFLGLGTNYMELQATTANSSSDALAAWNNTNPTSSVFTVNTKGSTNLNGSTYVAYCFAPVEGYSAFGSYVGNGSSDGPMVFTNFRPRWIMFKRTDAAGHWIVFDSARNTYNEIDAALRPNVSDPESTTYGRFDLLSNGVKIRTTDIGTNASSGTYIYAAFAENPFKTARAR